MTTNNPGYSENSPFTMNFADKNINQNVPQEQPVQPVQQNTPQPITQSLNNPDTVTGTDGTVFTWKNNPDLSPRNPINTQTSNTPNTPNTSQISQNTNIPVNYNVGVGREQEIIGNITDGIKNDTRVQQAVESGDFETFKKIYGYDTADDTKKRLLQDQFQASFRGDANSLFAGIIAGRQYAGEIVNRPEYQQAKERANKYLKYGSASVNELTAYMNNGELLQGTQAYEDLLRNPNIAEKLRQARQLAASRGNLDLENIGERTSKEIQEKSPNTIKMLQDGYISAEEYEREIMTPALRLKMDEVQKKKDKYDTLKREWDNIEEDVNNDTKYSGLSASGKRALIEDRRKQLRFTMGIAMDEYNNATGTLMEMQKQNASRLEMNMSLAREQMETERKKAMIEWEFQQKMKQQEMLANDPFNAISSMVEKYEKMGVPMQRSIHEMVEDFKKSGKTLPEYLTELNKTIQGKDEYKFIKNAQMQALLPKTEDVKYGFEKLDDGMIAVTNPKTGEVRYVNQSGAVIGGGVGISSSETQSIINQCVKNAQCGAGVNDYLRKRGVNAHMGDSYESKKKYVNSSVPQIGGLAIWQPSGPKAQPQYGHVGIVVGEEGDKVLIHDWNWDGDEQQKTHWVPKSAIAKNGGYMAIGGGNIENDEMEEKIYLALFNASGGSKMSESEGKKVQELAKKYAKLGLNPQQALLRYRGLDVQEKNYDTAMQYMDIGDNLTKKPNNYEMIVSKYINKGDILGLNNYINNLVDGQVKSINGSDAILSADYNNGNSRINTLVSAIERNKDKLGAFNGRVSDMLKIFKNDPEYQKIKTILQMTQAELRKYFAGSAVTETEMKALQDFIGGVTTMQPDNLITQLKAVQDDRKRTYEYQRQGMIPSGNTYSNNKLNMLTQILDLIHQGKPNR